ncbi:MAG: UBP-type zinc finger domain-containing protein [Cyanobacteria bacterium J06628_6]
MSCQHLDELKPESIIPKSNFPRFECEECIKVGSRWVHLRICQSCGKILCCDSSPNQHACKHYELSARSIISSAELGEQWLWCYMDEEMQKY